MLEFIIRLVKNFSKNDVVGTAAQTAFFLVLSIPPILVLTLSITANIKVADSIFAILWSIFPENVSEIFEIVINSIPKSSGATIISAVGVIFSSSGSVWALMKGIHKAHTQEKLSFSVYHRLLALLLTVVFMLSIIISLSLLIVGGVLTAITNTFSGDTFLFTTSKRVIALTCVYAFVYFIYRFTPGIKLKGMRLFWGALFSAFGWVIVSLLFGVYVTYFTKYTTIYGGISAFFILILWLYFISLVILTGAQINGTLHEFKTGRHNIF